MASSQVEIVSSSPFGCVLRNHGRNRNDRCRESNVRAVQAVFEKNLKDLVRDHINGCISISSSHENSQDHISRVASWVSNERANGNRHKLWLLNNKSQNQNQNNNDNNFKNEEPLPMSPRISRVLDRWVTKQAQDVKASTIDKRVNEAEPLAVPSNPNNASSTPSMTSTSNTKNTQNLTKQQDKSPVAHNLGASSLVQIWEARLNRSSSINSNQNQPQTTGATANNSGTSSGLSCNENNAPSSTVEEPPRDESFDIKSENGTKNEDSLIDWESQSDRTALSEPPSSIKIKSAFDAGERERLRVVDIIKRLTKTKFSEDGNDYEQSNNVTDAPSSERKHHSCTTSDQAEQRCSLQIVNSPRIRGRQAFNDLLMVMERDRNKELDSLMERQAVTKFSQRGRLQSMLRLRCLQRSVAIQDKCLPQPQGAHGNRLPQSSTILHLREKFSTSAGHPATSQIDSVPPRLIHRSNSAQPDKTSTSKIQNENTSNQNVSSSAEHQSTVAVNSLARNTNEETHEQTKQPSDHSLEQKISMEVGCTETLKTTEVTTSLEGQPENEMEKEQGPNSQQKLLLESQEIVETESSLNVYTQSEIVEQQYNSQENLFHDLQEAIETTSFDNCVENEIAQEQDIGEQGHLYQTSSQEIAETVTSYNDPDENETAEELVDEYQQYLAQRYDWFSNISRPKSYWEGLRQEWYQEVLNTTSEDEEIRQLLERGRVSSFLASDFRDKMDRLMISRVQIQADQDENQVDSEDDGDRMVQVMSYLQRHWHVGGQDEEQDDEKGGVQGVDGQEDEEAEEVYEEEEEDDDDEDEEERSLISHQFHEANSYFNQSTPSIQMPSPFPMRSWSYHDDNETNDNSDQGASTYSPPPTTPSPAPYYQDSPKSSPTNRPSLEMELICNLRAHIEQLHQELAELRKTVMGCMNMQMKMQQQSINWEVQSAEGRKEKNSERTVPWKRNCCICNEMQVDSLLYRCGHMCTCMKCAQELQWSSGKCPICEDQILDVVLASIPDKY